MERMVISRKIFGQQVCLPPTVEEMTALVAREVDDFWSRLERESLLAALSGPWGRNPSP